MVILVVGGSSGRSLGTQFGQSSTGWPALFVWGGVCVVCLLGVRGSGKLGASVLMCCGERIRAKVKTNSASTISLSFHREHIYANVSERASATGGW